MVTRLQTYTMAERTVGSPTVPSLCIVLVLLDDMMYRHSTIYIVVTVDTNVTKVNSAS